MTIISSKFEITSKNHSLYVAYVIKHVIFFTHLKLNLATGNHTKI